MHVVETFGDTSNGARRRLRSARGVVRSTWTDHLNALSNTVADVVDIERTFLAVSPAKLRDILSTTLGGGGSAFEHASTSDATLLCAREVGRFRVMLNLHREIHDLCKTATAHFVANGTVNETERDKAATELLPHWILYTLNDSGYQQDFSTDFVRLADPLIRTEVTGCRRILPTSMKLMASGEQLRIERRADTAQKASLISIENRYVGRALVDGGAPLPAVIELNEWQFAADSNHIITKQQLYPDAVIPVAETELRGSNVAVFQRCLTMCAGNKKAANDLSDRVAAATFAARKNLVEELQRIDAAAGKGLLSVSVKILVRDGGVERIIESPLPQSRPRTEKAQPTHSATSQGTDEDCTELIEDTSKGPSLSSGIAIIRVQMLSTDGLVAEVTHEQSITTAHLTKFTELHRISSPDSEASFPHHLASMLLRYAGLAGPNEAQGSHFHSSIHDKCAAALCKELNVIAEGFATPFNTNTPVFCSLFAETDAPFGSMGSFFNFRPRRGSFEVNPPFDTIVMTRLVAHLTDLLRAAGEEGDLTFFMVLPDKWDDGKLKAALDAFVFAEGAHCVAWRSVDQAQITYVGGLQHRTLRPYFRTKRDTLLAVFASEAAKRRAATAGFSWTAALDRVVVEWCTAVADVNEVAS